MISWLYRMFILVDANFRLSNKVNKSTDETDPCLTNGKAFVANTDELKAWTDHADKKKNKEKENAASKSRASCKLFSSFRWLRRTDPNLSSSRSPSSLEE